MKILPSPMLPVLAADDMISATLSTMRSGTTTSILIFGRQSTVYPPPRKSSVWPFCRPNPRTSETVMPMTPMEVSASLTSSSLKGLMMASIFFIWDPPGGFGQATPMPGQHDQGAEENHRFDRRADPRAWPALPNE